LAQPERKRLQFIGARPARVWRPPHPQPGFQGVAR
jgi:hypothetical protein